MADARIGAATANEPAVVVTTTDSLGTTLHLYDVVLRKTGEISVPLLVKDFIIAQAPPKKGDPWVVAVAARPPAPGLSYSLAIALDEEGKELWRYESPGSEFNSVAWVYVEPYHPGSLFLASRGAFSGIVKLSLDGKEEWRAEGHFFRALKSNPRITDQVVGTAFGRLFLLDARGNIARSTPVGKGRPTITDGMRLGEGDVVCSERGYQSTPELALYDASLSELWRCYPPEPIDFVTTLSDTYEGWPMILGLTRYGMLIAVDRQGNLRWRDRMFADVDLDATVRGLGKWSQPGKTCGWVLGYTDHDISVCAHPAGE